MSESVWAIVVAGGDGRRFGRPKQFVSLEGRLVVEWAVEAARAVADEVVLVVPQEVLADPSLHAGCAVVVAGGTTRSQSVRAGLGAIPDEVTVVVVHDAARPLASALLFSSVVDAVLDGADGAIPGIGVSDTVKRVESGRVLETVDRTGLVTVQTPQAFRAGVLRLAHKDEPEATDDAALLEEAGAHVVVVSGEAENVKLTEPADLARLAQALTRRRASSYGETVR